MDNCHEYSEKRCRVAHNIFNSVSINPCIKCKKCGMFVRPENMNSVCGKDLPPDVLRANEIHSKLIITEKDPKNFTLID